MVISTMKTRAHLTISKLKLIGRKTCYIVHNYTVIIELNTDTAQCKIILKSKNNDRSRKIKLPIDRL